MIFFPTFGFRGMVLPVIDSTNKLYLLIENENEHRVLLNITSPDVNKFINIESKSSKIVHVGNYKPNLELKVFYMGQELFGFVCEEINKEHLLFYSNYILKKEIGVDELTFDLRFIDGVVLTTTSKKPQSLYITIIDRDTNEVLHEDNFLSNEPYVFHQNDKFVNYGISIYNINGQKIYNYDLNLKNKKVWIKLESISVGETISWVPYVEEFRKKHQCKLLCTTYWNNLFINEYPNIEFVNDDEKISSTDLFITYKVRHKNEELDLQKIIIKILGLEYKDIKLNEVLEHIKKTSTFNTI